MAKIFEQESRTFSEYLLVPNLTTEDNTPDKVDLSAPIAKYKKGQEESRLKINIPMVSAVMQSVSDDGMAIALARCGGLSFVQLEVVAFGVHERSNLLPCVLVILPLLLELFESA